MIRLCVTGDELRQCPRSDTIRSRSVRIMIRLCVTGDELRQ